jgi:uncharacterized RDD family membrane protein YckC
MAVDAILQIVRGLAAAADGGILHRDVKPSNCFVDEYGLVKIGDFGVSRSLRPAIATTELSRLGLVVGTPAYASPEQLRGAALDIRSDIYSVGATLFELLTGRTPFAAADLMSMLMAVANDTPPAPHTFNPAIPKGLSAVVLRCLAKKPEQRYADYTLLAAALEPFSSATPRVASLGRRFIAGIVDLAIFGTPLLALSMNLPPGHAIDVAAFATVLLYFGLLENIWRATLGKAFCGLAVAGANGQSGSPSRVMARAAVYAICLVSVRSISSWEPSGLEAALGGPLAFWMVQAFALLPLAILFSTARHHDGAGLHDLASGTRVVEEPVKDSRIGLTIVAGPSERAIVGRAGPYDVLPDTVTGMDDGWRWGFDSRLRRGIWLRFSDPETPSVAPARRAVRRGTRLRWLAGRRLPNEAWDAYEAVEGAPLPEGAHAWTDVRWWLLDLARECAATTDADRAPRDPKRVWVLASGGIKWLDDPAADVTAPPRTVATDQQLLIGFARKALGDDGEPEIARSVSRRKLPCGAGRFLERLAGEEGSDVGAMVAELDALTKQRAVLTRAWRFAPIAICALVPAFALILATALAANRDLHRRRAPIDDRAAGALLWQLALADRAWLTLSVDDRESIERALATRYRDVVSDGRLFTPPDMDDLRLHDYHRAIANDVLRRYPQSLADRDQQVGGRAADIIRRATGAQAHPLLADAFELYLWIGILALIVNVVFRRGLIPMMGLELVTADGRRASRLRVLARTAITWSLFLLMPIAVRFVPLTTRGLTETPWWILTMAAGVVVVAMTPTRGVQDRIAGTWVVPR